MKRVLLFLGLVACSRHAPAPEATADAGAFLAPSSATVAARATPAATAATSGAAAQSSPCDFRLGYHGTIVGKEAFLRLERAGDVLVGRYFYAKFGVDIALAGTIDAANRVELVEGEARKPSGWLRGTCDPATGALDGEWSNSRGARPFHLEPVGPRASPLVATKRFSIVAKVTNPGPNGGKDCRYTQELVEIFGAGSPEAERAINRQGPSDVAPRVVAQGFEVDHGRCETGVTAEYTERVVDSYRGLLTIQRGGFRYVDGAAHPSNAENFDLATYDLVTGKAVTGADVYATFPEALVKRCVKAAFADADAGAGSDVLEPFYPDGHTFAIAPRGLHLWSASYPPVAAALTGQGPILAWGALLREGALRADSPVKRAWEGIAPAKPKDTACFDDQGKPLR